MMNAMIVSTKAITRGSIASFSVSRVCTSPSFVWVYSRFSNAISKTAIMSATYKLSNTDKLCNIKSKAMPFLKNLWQ